MNRNQELWAAARERVAQAEKTYRDLEAALEKRPGRRNARRLAKYAVRNYTSHYYSETLEHYYLTLARRWLPPPPAGHEIRPRSILHVMTSAYLSGGHTRIVERWIDSAPDDETHSVIITRQRRAAQVPDRLKAVVAAKSGILTILPYLLPILLKARRLRRSAAAYEYIVLHHNMTDPVPLMALGHPAFARPVIVFNHASHCFWIGRNAADLVIDALDSHRDLTVEKRGIRNTMMFSLPYDTRSNPSRDGKQQFRQSLGIGDDRKVLVSMASAYKYASVLDYDFTGMIRKILDIQPDVLAYIIGVESRSSPEWHQLKADYPDQLHLLGILPHEQVSTYLQAADLYLDSFPFNSFTSMLDAIAIGNLPVLSLKTPMGSPPFIQSSSALADTVDELIERAVMLLNRTDAASALYLELKGNIERLTCGEAFQRNVHEAYRRAGGILKDDTRYQPVRDAITDFDILSNEIYLAKQNA